MRKVYLIVCILAFLSFLTGIPYVITGISEHGMAGVNYGRILFPLLISGILFGLFRKTKQ